MTELSDIRRVPGTFRPLRALPPAYTEWIGRAHLATLTPVLEVAA
ncbi:hypothetical protein ABZ742_21045 [Streptomyces albogriseolus]